MRGRGWRGFLNTMLTMKKDVHDSGIIFLHKKHCPTNEDFGPGWDLLWVDVQQMMNLAPDGVRYG
jgi:hypothetical protein